MIMEGFYVVFDKDNERIGFAITTCPNRDPNSMSSSVSNARNQQIGKFI